jgi:hypothetical protein
MKTKDKMIGAGIGLAALAAAGTYFLYGKKGSKSRETIEGWALQLKGEVLSGMEKLKDINQQAYNDLVEDTAKRYGKTKNVGAVELKRMTLELKNAWAHIGKQLN